MFVDPKLPHLGAEDVLSVLNLRLWEGQAGEWGHTLQKSLRKVSKSTEETVNSLHRVRNKVSWALLWLCLFLLSMTSGSLWPPSCICKMEESNSRTSTRLFSPQGPEAAQATHYKTHRSFALGVVKRTKLL